MRKAPLAVALAGLLLAGCASIPTSGRVIEYSEIDLDERALPDVGGVARGPAPGAEPSAVVEGFLEAMRFYQPNYETARQFLAPAASRDWVPDAATTVYNAEPRVSEVDIDEFTLELSVAATVDGARAYTKADDGEFTEYTIELEQIGGQWRITNPPAGLIISDADFEGEFSAYNLYFYDPAFDVLVPDPVFLPTQGPVPTLLARELLEGPSAWLEPAVRTAFPAHTQLAVDAVVVSSGVAEVKLSEDALAAGEDERRLMVEQLAWTLGEVPGVSTVVVHGGQTVLGETSVHSFPTTDPADVRSASLFAITDDGVVRLGADGVVAPVAGPLGEMPDLSDIAVNPQMTEAIVVHDSRLSVRWSRLRSDAEPEIVAEGTALRSPSFDRTGTAWVLSGEGSGTVVLAAWPGRGVTAEVDVAELTMPIDALAVSADGTRIVLASGGVPYVGVIVRGQRPDDLQIVNVRPLIASQIIGPVLDVTWDQYDHVAVLTGAREDDSASGRVYRIRLDTQTATAAGIAAEAESLAGNWREPMQLVAGLPEMVLVHQPRTLGWAPVEGVRQPTYPG